MICQQKITRVIFLYHKKVVDNFIKVLFRLGRVASALLYNKTERDVNNFLTRFVNENKSKNS